MHLTLFSKSTLVVIVALSAALGCTQQATGPAKPSAHNAQEATAQASRDALRLPRWTQADGARGYLHKQSGIGFICPEGWEWLGVVRRESFTRLGLGKDGTILVNLYWTPVAPMDPDLDLAAAGTYELLALRELYGDRVSGPDSVTVAGQAWGKLPIAGGPFGVNDSDLAGVVYVFALRRNQEVWKIKLRATARDPEKLATVEELLKNFRQE